MSQPIPLKSALFWIFLSTLLISGTSFLVFLYYVYIKELRTHDDKYRVMTLVQTCPNKECLKTVFLAELLDLSVDRPSNLYLFNAREAQKKLLANPLIKEASVKKMSPGTIYVDYTLRMPIAFLGDYANTAIDDEGYVFPFQPFFTPKKLPKVFVGEFEFSWGKPLQGKHAQLALTLLRTACQMCSDLGMHLVQLDVSKAFSPSYGQRQIVITVEDREEKIVGGRPALWICPTILRLSTDHISQQLANYTILRSKLRQQELLKGEAAAKGFIVDLRIPELAFIAKNPL